MSPAADRLDSVGDLRGGHAKGADDGERVGVLKPGPAQLGCLVVRAVGQHVARQLLSTAGRRASCGSGLASRRASSSWW